MSQIINPLTGRLIQVGGATHKELMRHGMWGGGDREKAEQLIDQIDQALQQWLKTTLRPIIEDAYGVSRAAHPFIPDSLHEHFRKNPTMRSEIIDAVFEWDLNSRRLFLEAIGAENKMETYAQNEQKTMGLFDKYIDDGHTKQDLVKILRDLRKIIFINKWKLESSAEASTSH